MNFVLPITRKNKIKELITEKKSVTVSELTNLFNVTDETIRRDLQQLEKEGFLYRAYGGAYISEGVENDVDVNIREHIHIEGKQKIANSCIKFIKNGDSIFLDSSTTSLGIASLLKGFKLTVTTNSIKIANKLYEFEDINVVLIGGKITHPSMSCLGRIAESNLKNYFFDICFTSCRALNMNHGITDSNELQAEIRKLAIEHANKTFLVADYTKFDRTAFTRICDFSKINTIVVDNELSEEWREFLKTENVDLIESK